MTLKERQQEIILQRKWWLVGAIMWLVVLWVLAFVGKSPDMVEFAIGGTIATSLFTLVYRIKSKLEYDENAKYIKGN